ncbi:MAG: hypothetical protein A4E73_00290 [Syntrophaceae bacterium PtaU1.Bin231]|nr:MAG: hypothetical protein A4E73_00290 [Syntrophaceae bacterium PtaU1.Bin231]
MKCLAMFGGLAAAMGMAGTAAARQSDPPPQREASKKRYRVTEHVRRYYETAG